MKKLWLEEVKKANKIVNHQEQKLTLISAWPTFLGLSTSLH